MQLVPKLESNNANFLGLYLREQWEKFTVVVVVVVVFFDLPDNVLLEVDSVLGYIAVVHNNWSI